MFTERIAWLFDEGRPLTDTEARLALEHEIRPPEEVREHIQEHGTREGEVSREAVQGVIEDFEDMWDINEE
jgi:hypothetical protein